MKNVFDSINPTEVFAFFGDICNIPHGSCNEEALSNYFVNFAKERNLYCVQDEYFNVLIRKPASEGYENSDGIIFQAHMDMVCEKNNGTKHDFMKDSIKPEIEGDKLIAKETTLGADNGIGIAIGLAILDSKDIKHSMLELLLTTREEFDFAGTENFDATSLKGNILINLDSDDEGVFVVGSAGGPAIDSYFPVVWEDAAVSKAFFKIKIEGLTGGHSGEDIEKGRGNACKILCRILMEISEEIDFKLVDIKGGMYNNAIPREAFAVIECTADKKAAIGEICAKIKQEIEEEYIFTESSADIVLTQETDIYTKVFSALTTQNVIRFGYLCETGIQRLCADKSLEPAVESSNCLGVIKLTEKGVMFQFCTRSIYPSIYNKMKKSTELLSEMLGGFTVVNADFLEWTYNSNSRILGVFTQKYKEIFNIEPKKFILHGGLECGIIGKNMKKNVDMISIGPDIRNLHSPGEWVSVSSVQRLWRFFMEIIPELK